MLATYNAKEVIINYGGITLTGYADGDFCSVDMAEDAWTHVTGADGEEARSKSNNLSAIATITLLQTSDGNRILTESALADKATNAGVKPLLITDKSGNSLHSAKESYVVRVPAAPYGKAVGTRQWQLRMVNALHYVGGNQV